MGMHDLLQKDQELWDLFCRKEEYEPSIRDKYNRFPYYASTCHTVFTPRASEYLMNNGYPVHFPDGKPFAVCLTHDIDLVYAPALQKSVETLKQFHYHAMPCKRLAEKPYRLFIRDRTL